MSIKIRQKDLEGRLEVVGELFNIWCTAHKIMPTERDCQEVISAFQEAIKTKSGKRHGVPSVWNFLILVDYRNPSHYVGFWGNKYACTRKQDTAMDEEFCKAVVKYASKKRIEAINPYVPGRRSQYVSEW